MRLKCAFFLFLLLIGSVVQAVTLSEAAQKAVLQNPDVLARWRAFNGSVAQQDAARGGYFPRVDVSAGAGRERLAQPNLPEESFNRRNTSISLSQMLFDGFATRNEVRRLGYTKLVRYNELLDASESSAFEAARAYYDVLRYRKLKKRAEENFAQHKVLFDQMQQRAKAGVGRRVDFEQAGGRLALAESNLLTEISNLHDVSARYQRVVGELPPAEMAEPPSLDKGFPATGNEAAALAISLSPAVSAAVENIRAAQMDLNARNASAFVPRVELRARQDFDRNLLGVIGNREDRAVEVVMNYNLFKGGADNAVKRQLTENVEAAKDLRDKACRDVRQTVAIAFNDTRRITEQLGYLNTHQLAAEKARDAYRQQFDIGQRTLLDLLDTENELFQARRAYVNAQYDLNIAYARAQSAMGKLLAVLKLRHLEVPSIGEMGETPLTVDPATTCRPEVPVMEFADKEAAIAEASINAPTPSALGSSAPAAISDEEQLQKTIKDWAAAWAGKDVTAYLSHYASQFKSADGKSREQWLKQQRAHFAQSAPFGLTIDGIKVRFIGDDNAISEFRQTYRSNGREDVTLKTMTWHREAGRWLIVSESSAK